jgi:D-inositol-3-phosphate glycosyltransferase
MNVYVRELALELIRQGIQVDIFTRASSQRELTTRHPLGPGSHLVYIQAGPLAPIPIDDMAQHIDQFAAGVMAYGRSFGRCYDVIHSHYWLSGLVAEKLRNAWPDAPVVHMFHTLGHMKNQIAQDDSQRASQLRLDGEAQVVQRADRLIAATPAEEAQLVTLYAADPAKISILPPGVDLARFRPMPQDVARSALGIPLPPHRNILFAGRIERLKGIDTLLHAIALLREQAPATVADLCVCIIGGDPWAATPDVEMARLQRMRAELALDNVVTFRGARDQDELPSHYAAADMLVMPSHYESFGMVSLEAMAMGTPVIASDVGGLAYLVQDGVNGFKVPQQDPQALADRIRELLEDDERRHLLGCQAWEFAQDFGWSQIVDRLLPVYAQAQRGPVQV